MKRRRKVQRVHAKSVNSCRPPADYKLAWNGNPGDRQTTEKHQSDMPVLWSWISKDNRMTQARFACVECGFEENADVVGAINVLRAGHARLACEVSGATMPPAAGTHRSESGVYA